MKSFIIVVAMLVASAVHAQDPPPTLKLPPEVKGEKCTFIEIKAETTAKKVIWDIPEGVDGRTFGDGKILLCVCKAGGRYSIRAIAAVGDEPLLASCVLIVSNPDPPPPPPPPPPPADKFVADVQAAYRAAPDDVSRLKLLELYRKAVTLCVRQDITTAGRLSEIIRQAGETLLGDKTKLVAVRQRVGQELGSKLGVNPDAPLTELTRSAAADVYAKASLALEGVTR